MTERNTPTSNVEISKRLVFINSASSICSRLLNISILIWLYEYLLTRISPEEFAIYPVVAAIMVFAPLFTSLLTGGVSRYIIDAYAVGDRERVTQLVSSILPLLIGAGIVFLGLGFVFAWNIDHLLTIPTERVWDARMKPLAATAELGVARVAPP